MSSSCQELHEIKVLPPPSPKLTLARRLVKFPKPQKRLACEAMATQMTALVLNDEKEQIKTNTLYQKIVDSNPTADLESASEQMNVLYKTELCRSWQFGQCKERLIFAIYDSELRN